MAQPAALLILPALKHAGTQRDAVQVMTPLLTQSLEDVRLAEQVQRALRATGYGQLRHVEVTVHARLVILSGRVAKYYLKQLAQTTALAVSTAVQVRNDLEVDRPSRQP